MTKQTEHRRANGRRLEGHGLAQKLATSVRGMPLAQAYVAVRSAGCDLRVSKLDGVTRTGLAEDGRHDDRINVAVASGLVQQGWVG